MEIVKTKDGRSFAVDFKDKKELETYAEQIKGRIVKCVGGLEPSKYIDSVSIYAEPHYIDCIMHGGRLYNNKEFCAYMENVGTTLALLQDIKAPLFQSKQVIDALIDVTEKFKQADDNTLIVIDRCYRFAGYVPKEPMTVAVGNYIYLMGVQLPENNND